MPNLVIMHDQTGATGKDIVPLPDCITPTEALMIHFPQGINPEAAQVFVGITRMVLPNESDNPSKELLEPLTQNMIVVMEAKGLENVLLGFVAFAAAIKFLTPKIPGDVGQQKQSPNNDLQGQTNIARPYQAYPLIFGSPVSFPDLTGEPIVEYINNQKIVRQLMVVGDGLFDIAETRAGSTPITNFSGASATYYEPLAGVVTVPEVVNVFSTNEIDGQELLGADNDVIIAAYNLTENGSNLTTYVGTTYIMQVIKDAESDALFTGFGVSVTPFKLKVNYKGDFNGQSGVSSGSGVGIVNTMILNGGSTFYTIELIDFNGKATVDDIYIYDTPFVSDNVANSILGPLKIAVQTNEVWLNFSFLRGLKSTVSINVRLTKLDGPNGNPIVGPSPDSYNLVYTKDTLDQQFETHKQLLFSSTPSYYQITLERLDNGTNDANEPDQTTVEAVYAVSRESNVQYGNLTLLDVVMPATINATSLRENKVNIDLTSKLITYESGAINYTPQPSRKMADAILHLTVDFYNRDPNTLALDELYEIQDRLDLIDPRLTTFDFTFDDIDVSYDERMDAILQVARCYKWLDGDVYRFGRNDIRENESTSITRRDISSDDVREYSLSYNPQLLENYDSVKVEYVNNGTNKKSYIFRTVDDFGNIIEGTGVNPKSLELAGCSEEYNAINRAELEIRTLLYQRFSLTDTMEPSAMFLDKGDMVLYAEQYNVGGDTFDGEILNVVGDVVTTSESLDLLVGNQYNVHYTTTNGSSVGPFTITPVSEFSFQCLDLGQVFLRDSILGFNVQTGSRYIISTVEELEASRWSIIEKEARGRNIQLTMVNYDERIYSFDEA